MDSEQLVALKAIHYECEGESNFLLCPGQTALLQLFRNPMVRSCYLFLKACNVRLALGFKSYQLKKLVLGPGFSRRRNECDLLWAVVSLPGCAPRFAGKGVDMGAMEERARGEFRDFQLIMSGQ